MKSTIMTIHSLERFLAIVGAVACLIISIYLGQLIRSQQPLWPLPGLYLVEVAGVSLIAMVNIIQGNTLGRWVTWVVVGVLSAFVVMGRLSIGFCFLPIAFIFTITAISLDRRRWQSLVIHLGICIIAGLAQTVLMLTIIRLL
jgi:hypothetical protein